jgi:alkaline phosphatase D
MPVRPAKIPLLRRYRFGTLAELSVLDPRSYRDRHPAALSSVIDDPNRTITPGASSSTGSSTASPIRRRTGGSSGTR